MISNYSRLRKLEGKRDTRKAIKFTIASLVLLLFLAFVGLPLLIKFAGFLLTIRSSSTTVQKDTVPPAPPNISSLPQITNQSNLTVTGSAESGSTVTIFIGDSSFDVVANASGSFSESVTLSEGDNTITAQAKDTSGNISVKTNPVTIFLDTKPPSLSVKEPKDKQSFFGQSNRQLNINGSTDKNCTVYVNDRLALLDNNGNFSTQITLNTGDNTLNIKSLDQAGNSTELTLTVSFSQ